LVVTQSTGRVSAEALLTELYEQHSAAVFRYALHLTGRREDAEDVVQHVYIQAFRQLEGGVELVNPLAWLMKAAKYRSLNVIRDRREIPTDGSGFDALAAPESDQAEAGELAAVRSMLWALPESQHQAFVLRHWSGLSQTEIADVLSTTTSAVESLLVRARGALLDDRDQADGECRTARQALVDSRQLASGESAHVEHCRRCRTARSRLLRATEFATALALVPRPHVAHAIASVVPGFSATAGAGSIGTAAGAATGSTTAGATALSSSVPLAAKGTVAAKALAAVVAATVAVSAVQPIRQPIVNTIMHHLPGQVSSQHRVHAAATAGISKNGPDPGTTAGSAGGPPAGAGGGRATAPGQVAGHGSATGKGQGNPHPAGANGTAHGKSASGSGNGQANGHAKGKSATAGSNGKAGGTPAGGGNGKATGTPAGGPGNGHTTGTAPPPAGAGGNGNGNGNGTGQSAAGGSGKANGTSPSGGADQPSGSTGNGKAKRPTT
jgi:RNA polymerase sigma factor (sigma-70 family)